MRNFIFSPYLDLTKQDQTIKHYYNDLNNELSNINYYFKNINPNYIIINEGKEPYGKIENYMSPEGFLMLDTIALHQGLINNYSEDLNVRGYQEKLFKSNNYLIRIAPGDDLTSFLQYKANAPATYYTITNDLTTIDFQFEPRAEVRYGLDYLFNFNSTRGVNYTTKNFYFNSSLALRSFEYQNKNYTPNILFNKHIWKPEDNLIEHKICIKNQKNVLGEEVFMDDTSLITFPSFENHIIPTYNIFIDKKENLPQNFFVVKLR